MDLELTVNYVPFDLGERLDLTKLAQAKFGKAGILRKAAALAAPWTPIYWAAGPTVSCFLPRHHSWEQTRDVLRTPGRAFLAGDSALSVYLYCWEGAIQRVKMIEVGRRYRNVDVYVDLLTTAAIKNLGAPTFEDSRVLLWSKGDRELIVGKGALPGVRPPSHRDFLFLQWTRGEWRRDPGRLWSRRRHRACA